MIVTIGMIKENAIARVTDEIVSCDYGYTNKVVFDPVAQALVWKSNATEDDYNSAMEYAKTIDSFCNVYALQDTNDPLSETKQLISSEYANR